MPGMDGDFQAACALHPERPALQPCSRCGTFACGECLSQSPPGASLCTACVSRDAESQLPWDYREEQGVVRAWFKSLGPILLHPGRTFATAKPEGDVGGSLLFCIIANFIGFFSTGLLFVSVGAQIPLPGDGLESRFPFRAIMMGSYGMMILVVPIFGLISTVIFSAFDHLVLRMVGKPRSYETTLRGAALAQAALILGLIPFCSVYITPFWILVVKIFAYRGLHRTTTGVAVAGALLFPMVAIVGFCGLAFILFSVVLASSSAITQ